MWMCPPCSSVQHTDHTKVTINISLTDDVTDFEAGGVYFPTPKGMLTSNEGADARAKKPPTGCAGRLLSSGAVTASQQSQGLLLKPALGHALVHHGDLRHAGDRITRGERLQLIAFFYGSERRGNSLHGAAPSARLEQVRLGARPMDWTPPIANSTRNAAASPTRHRGTKKPLGPMPTGGMKVDDHADDLKDQSRLITLATIAALAQP